MAASSSNPSVIVNIGENYPYPYPSHVFVPSFLSVKMSGKNTYLAWNKQMLCLLRSHDMLGFINGDFKRPDRNGQGKVGDMSDWNRSDSLVRGWILGSLSDQVAMNVVSRLTPKHKKSDFTAKDAWDTLQNIYGLAPSEQPSVKEEKIEDANKKWEHQKEQHREEHKLHLYGCIQKGKLHEINHWLVEDAVYDMKIRPTSSITNNGNTALHVAVAVDSSTKSQEILKHLLDKIPESVNLRRVRNIDGSTPLHVAAIVGNTEAAKILLQRNRQLLLARDKKGQTPLAISLSNMNTQMSEYLLDHIIEANQEYDSLFTGPSGDKLLELAISSKDFGRLLSYYKTIHSEVVLMAVAQNFPSDLGFWGRMAYIKQSRGLDRDLDDNYTYHAWSTSISNFNFTRDFDYIKISIKIIIMAIVRPFIGKRVRNYHEALCLLDKIFERIKDNDLSHQQLYYSKPVFEATRQNSYTVVTNIVRFFLDAIWSTNEDGHNFIQYAVIQRSEKIYNLLYNMNEKNIYKTMEDSSGNNLLHLAARLAPTNKLNLISGAALQMQRELQWFREVEGFVCPLNTVQKNSADETPEMVFSREHKELLLEGEKWMKTTAESYTITAALIITIVFAAAITVPGGNNQDTGVPVFTNKTAFIIFAISDAVSLFTAVTSLLMFLSILTARFAEQDFLLKLPTKLIIGLTTLFISTTAMIIAFGATLFLVFGHENSWILIPIGVLTCLPITSFVTLQFPLIIDLMRATFVRSIFVKTKTVDLRYGYFY